MDSSRVYNTGTHTHSLYAHMHVVHPIAGYVVFNIEKYGAVINKVYIHIYCRRYFICTTSDIKHIIVEYNNLNKNPIKNRVSTMSVYH